MRSLRQPSVQLQRQHPPNAQSALNPQHNREQLSGFTINPPRSGPHLGFSNPQAWSQSLHKILRGVEVKGQTTHLEHSPFSPPALVIPHAMAFGLLQCKHSDPGILWIW